MHLETHLAIGWGLANLMPRSMRRERLLVCLAAVLPDADGLSYLAGPMAYGNWHHTLGHNIFTAVAVLLFAALLGGGRRWLVVLASQAAFWSHLAGDYFMSGWSVEFFWPVSREGWMWRPRIGLDHPANVALSYASFILMAGSWWIWHRSPLEFVWPKMDTLIGRVVHPGTLRCDGCGERTSLKQGKITKGLRLVCSRCAESTMTGSRL